MISVPAGSILRVQVRDLSRCALYHESWSANNDECYFPFDLYERGVTNGMIELKDGKTYVLRFSIADPGYGVQELTVPPAFLRLTPEDLRRIEEENQRISRLWNLRSPRRYHLPLSPPLNPLPEGKGFGVRRIIGGEERLAHSGVDFSSPRGTPVYASEEGEVVLSGRFFFSGNSVFLDHGDGLISMYFHLDRILVKQGSIVHRGEQIGTVGATGRATGPHLHFAIRYRGRRVDPHFFLREVPPFTPP
jgi:murein DD-endopeptidase MepM/ murein hydrolase activator NlpD